MKFNPKLEECRVRDGELRSNPGDPYGAFRIQGPCGALLYMREDGMSDYAIMRDAILSEQDGMRAEMRELRAEIELLRAALKLIAGLGRERAMLDATAIAKKALEPTPTLREDLRRKTG